MSKLEINQINYFKKVVDVNGVVAEEYKTEYVIEKQNLINYLCGIVDNSHLCKSQIYIIKQILKDLEKKS